MPILATAVIFATVFVFVLALGGSDDRVRARLEALRGGPVAQPVPEQGLSFSERLIRPMFAVPVQTLKRLMPENMLKGTEQRLLVAGEPMTLNAFLTFRLVSAVTLIALPFLLIGSFGAAGILLPQMWLNQRVSHRQNLIIKSLPDAFDLITTCVEAGLG